MGLNFSKTIRIFVSSTFSDMTVEREVLMGDVYKELTALCNDEGWQFEFVDMRWGITDMASAKHKTMQICISELERCQYVSPNFNLLVLMGERYGWRPLPEYITKKEFEFISTKLQSNSTYNKVFNDFYFLDLNDTDGKRILVNKPSEEELAILTKLLHEVAEEVDNVAIKSHFTCSATHLELYSGKVCESVSSDNVAVYMRDFTDSDAPIYFYDDKNAPDYEESCTMLTDLKNSLRDVYGGKEEQFISKTLDYSSYEGDDYRSFLKEKFLYLLRPIVMRELEDVIDDTELDRIYHQRFMTSRAEIFFGRDCKVDELISKLEKRDSSLFLVHGVSGSGKSSFMSYLALQLAKNGCDSVIFKSVGVSPFTNSGQSTLLGVLKELQKQGANLSSELDLLSYNDLIDELCIFMRSYNGDKRFVIFVDAIDQFPTSDAMRLFEKQILPFNDKIVFVVSKLTECCDEGVKGSSSLEIRPFDKGDIDACLSIVTENLKINSRCLTNEQTSVLHEIFTNAESLSPIYLILLAGVLKSCRYTDVIQYTDGDFSVEFMDDIFVYNIPSTVEKVIVGFFNIVSSEENHSDFAKLALSFISNARRGVSFSEILELTAKDTKLFEVLNTYHKVLDSKRLPPIMWSRLYYDIISLLRKYNSLGGEVVHFYHAVIAKSIAGSLEEDMNLKSRSILLDYFTDKWENEHQLRAMDELPEILLRDKRYEQLVNLLCSVDYIQSMADNKLLFDNFHFLDTMPESERSAYLVHLYGVIRKRVYIFNQFASEINTFTAQFLLNLFCDGELHAKMEEYVTERKQKTEFNILRRLNSPKYVPNRAKHLVLRGPDWCIRDVAVDKDFTLALTCDDKESTRVWNLTSGKQEGVYYLHDEDIYYITMNEEKTHALSASEDRIVEWEIATGTVVREFTLPNNEPIKCVDVCMREGVVYAASETSVFEWREGSASLFYTSNSPIVALELSDNNKYLAVATTLGLNLCSVAQGVDDSILFISQPRIESLHFTSNDTILYIMTNNAVKRVNLIEDDVSCVVRGEQGDLFCAFTTDVSGDIIFVGDVDGIISEYNLKTATHRRFQAHSKDVTAMVCNVAGDKLITVSRDRRCVYFDLTKELKELTSSCYTSCVYMNASGSDILTVSNNAQLKLWDKDLSTTLVSTLPKTCFAVDKQPFGSLVAVAYGDGAVAMVDTASGVVTPITEGIGDTFVNSVRFSPTGNKLIVASVDRAGEGDIIVVVDSKTLSAKGYTESSLGFKREKHAYSSSCSLAELKNKFFIAHMNSAYATDISPDGTLMAIAGRDKSVVLFDLKAEKCYKRLVSTTNVRHTNEVKCVKFTPDGRYLVSAGWDNTAILWDLVSGQAVGEAFNQHLRGIYALDISSDARILVTGARDGSAIVWDLQNQKFINRFVSDASCNAVSIKGDCFYSGYDSGDVAYTLIEAYTPLNNTHITNIVLSEGKHKAQCPYCGGDLHEESVEKALAFISLLESKAYPALELDRSHFENENLKCKCSHCGVDIKINPFICEY